MAKHNSVYLFGAVLADPKIFINADGQPERAQMTIDCMRRRGLQEKYNRAERFDTILIYSRNPECIKVMQDIKKYDIVFVKGVFTTKNVKKRSICAECGERNEHIGLYNYITPISITKFSSENDAKACEEIIRTQNEISNMFTGIGALVNEPELYKSENGNIVQYQLALNRKYRIKEDATEIRTDYPWVKNYNDMALQDADSLHTGDLVFIDGSVQQRTVSVNVDCEFCGQRYNVDESTLEIAPYEVEYLFNNRNNNE